MIPPDSPADSAEAPLTLWGCCTSQYGGDDVGGGEDTAELVASVSPDAPPPLPGIWSSDVVTIWRVSGSRVGSALAVPAHVAACGLVGDSMRLGSFGFKRRESAGTLKQGR